MPAPSPIVAVMNLYDGLTAANFPGGVRPTAYFGEAPQASAGTQVRVPYTVIEDQAGFSGEAFSDAGAVLTGKLVVKCFAFTLGNAAIMSRCVRWNGQPPASRAGFDWGTLSIDAPFYHVHLKFLSDRSTYAGLDASDRVHCVELTYECKVGVNPAQSA